MNPYRNFYTDMATCQRFTEDGAFKSQNFGENDHYQNQPRLDTLFPEVSTKNQNSNFIKFVWQMGGGTVELPIRSRMSFNGQILGNSTNDIWNCLLSGANARHSQYYIRLQNLMLYPVMSIYDFGSPDNAFEALFGSSCHLYYCPLLNEEIDEELLMGIYKQNVLEVNKQLY